MGTTTNYGWPTPVATDYVTDGWDAIKDLGDAIDTTVALIRVPTGCVLPYAANSASAPDGFLYARGQTVSRTTYAALYAVIGTTYGAGDGSTTFGLPNLQTRVPAGLDASGTPDTSFDVLGETGGSKSSVASHDHGAGTLTSSSTGSHTHTLDDLTQSEFNNHVHDVDAKQTSSASHTHTGTTTLAAGISGGTDVVIDIRDPTVPASFGSTANAGGTHSHTISGTSGSSGTSAGNLPPYIVLNYIIKT